MANVTELSILAHGNGGGASTEPADGGEQSHIRLIPYNALLDPMGHEFLAYLWTRMRNDGIFEMFFHDAPDLNFAQFVRCFTPEHHSVIAMVARVQGKNADGSDHVTEHLGLFSLGQAVVTPLLKRAIGSFAFFRDFWNHKDADEAGRMCLEYAFKTIGIDIMAGVTPKANRAALSFIHRLGFVSSAEIPDFMLYKGQRTDAVISYLTRQMWGGA